MKKNKNILHVVNVFFVIPYFLGNQLLFFKDLGYDSFIACSPSKELKAESIKKKFQYIETPISRSISILNDLKSIVNIIRYIKKNKIDIVIGHTPKGGLLAMIAAFIIRVPKRIYFRHGLVFETAKGFKRFLLINMDRLTASLATKIIVVSPSVFDESIKYKLNSANKQVILHKGTCNGIDIDWFDSSKSVESNIIKLKNELKIPMSNIIIGFTGRLVVDKGINELVDAFQMLKKKYANISLLLVGMNEERDGLPLSTIDKIQADQDIIVTGYIANAIIMNYYALMDIYILPSYREGFPTSVLEASAMKLPVVTTKVTGCIDSIIENVTGIFVDNNKNSICDGLEKYLNSKELRILHGEKGREFVEGNFKQILIWNELNEIYMYE